ncbi:MAG: DNA polymerase III subunit alpha [Rhodobacteraceae bacterium]|nr:DNA polymerase III subunit alpha [Paracoccaceae bacterium]MCY4195547.1 DNA polymerase III subunit alpha [Paracoccaceae bacterium]
MQDLPRFVHLRVRSEYSLLEGAVRLADLPDLCVRHEMPAVAVTDNSNLFGALEFATKATGKGIQPIHGCHFALRLSDEETETGTAAILLLAKDETGYRSLLKLNSCLYLGSHAASDGLSLDDLRDHSAGLICLTGGADGPVGRPAAAGRRAESEAALRVLADIFPGHIYVEIQRHKAEGSDLWNRERRAETVMLELAYQFELPLVATNDVHFPDQEMFAAHDALICINQAAHVEQVRGRRQLTEEHYFKSQQAMAELFADLPEALTNSVEIARRCTFWAKPRAVMMPRFTDSETAELELQARDGLNRRLDVITPAAPIEAYRERLEYELGVIIRMGFAGYFLIVADFIKWAKRNRIPVGAGRGSGAGSLVAYSLTITDIDPLRFDLLFERFLNPERVSMPDFDVDFCQERREEVIRYVQERYGADRVAQIITFGALLSRLAVRDVGRVLRVPYRKVDEMAKMLPRDGVQNVPIREALQREPRLREMCESDPVIRRLFDTAQLLEGLFRNASTHAAGIVIGDRPLDEIVPLYRDPRSSIPATQFSMKWVEKAGLVKFDFLGLKTLTAIRKTIDLLAAMGTHIDINNVSLEDQKTYRMCAAAETVAVFQLESTGMKETLRRLKPTCIEDIVALVALYRPGPMDNIPTYCDVKNGIIKRKKQHETIDHIVAETHGIMVYQEQVMQIAQSMAGYSLGQADLLRRAIGKKVQSEMDAAKPKFLEGASNNKVDQKTANETWELMARFAEYGFPKAHAAAYGLVSYQTAWLKANHPMEFMASVMNCDISDPEKLKSFAGELRRLKIRLRPPCINESEAEFSVRNDEVVYGLCAVRNAGAEAMRQLVETRKSSQFKDLFDFAGRVELKRIGRRQMESLVLAGVFDSLEPNRKRIFDSLDLLIAHSNACFAERQASQDSLFGDDLNDTQSYSLPASDEWSTAEKSEKELFAIGYYLSGHPLDELWPSLREQGVCLYSELLQQVSGKPKNFKLAGMIIAVQRRVSQKGKPYAVAELSDPSGNYEIVVFDEMIGKVDDVFRVGFSVKTVVSARQENDRIRLWLDSVQLLDISDNRPTGDEISGLRIHFRGADTPRLVRNLLDSNCRANGGSGEIRFCPVISDLDFNFEIEIPNRYALNPKIKQAIASIEGVDHVEDQSG